MPLHISIRMEFSNGIVRSVSLPQHGFLVGLCLHTAMNHLSKSDKYLKEPVRSHRHADKYITSILEVIYNEMRYINLRFT